MEKPTVSALCFPRLYEKSWKGISSNEHELIYPMQLRKLILNLPVLLRTVRHLRFRQVLARLRLILRRKWRVWWADWYRRKINTAFLPELSTRKSLPRPQFPARDQCIDVVGDQTYRLSFLNTSREFSHPFEWRPSEFERGTRLWLLNLHYMEYLEALPDKAFREVVDDWISNVPPYQSEYWKSDWNSYALSIRTVVWMQQYTVRRDRLPPQFKKHILTSITRQLRFLNDNIEFDVSGNHIIKNIKALLWGGRLWGHDEALEWRNVGLSLLREHLEQQILEDGMHFERSPSYHLQVFSDLIECYQTLDDVNKEVKDELRDILSKMAQAVFDLKHPDGKVALFNDSTLNMTYAPDTCLSVWK
jgi:uncharacterized heparinase superfamily protein